MKAQNAGKTPYMSTQFNDNYHKWARVSKATMRIQHKPSDTMEVDWAGATEYLSSCPPHIAQITFSYLYPSKTKYLQMKYPSFFEPIYIPLSFPYIDCFDSMPIKQTIGTSPNAKPANPMLKEAITTFAPNEKPIVHSIVAVITDGQSRSKQYPKQD